MTASSLILELAPEVDFESFVASHQVRLRRYALALTGNGSDADDLLQTTLVKVFLAWNRMADHEHVAGYARTTLARSYVSAWRRWGSRVSPTDQVPEIPVLRSAADTASDRDLIWRGLDRLGRRQRAVVVLRYFEDYDIAAIAEALGITQGTVKSQLSRALTNLRDILGGVES